MTKPSVLSEKNVPIGSTYAMIVPMEKDVEIIVYRSCITRCSTLQICLAKLFEHSKSQVFWSGIVQKLR
jgi:hypothetical protein